LDWLLSLRLTARSPDCWAAAYNLAILARDQIALGDAVALF
jgi:hypothetical protein